ncbi:F-actin capping protein alpha subunit [Cryptosporidium felis]|nr:F-actin capping protein alpha subunit [Cryptosporidium felis]
MENSETILKELCENSAPGLAIGILEKCRCYSVDLEIFQETIERLAADHLEKYSFLIPIKNLDQNTETIFWGVISKYSRVEEEESNILFKYIDPFLKMRLVVQASSLEVVDVEKLEIIDSASKLTSIRKRLEIEFLDPHIINFANGSGIYLTNEVNRFESLDFKDFDTPMRRTVIYDSEIFPKISQDKKETLIVVRSAGSWHSEWKLEFPKNKSENELVWRGTVLMHCYNSENGNSHLIYEKKDLSFNIVSDKYSASQLIEDPSLFARESARMISENERYLQSKVTDIIVEFKEKYIKKLRRALPINPISFDWGGFRSALQDPLNESVSFNSSH